VPAPEVILTLHTSIYITSTSPSAQCSAKVCKPVKKISLRQVDSASHSKRPPCPATPYLSLVAGAGVGGSSPLVGSSVCLQIGSTH
jgi:hypothetical protein